MTAIEWTQRPGTKGETWNPVVGCSPVSPGCLNCYAATMARRLEAMGKAEYQPVTEVHLPGGVAGRTVRIAEVKAGPGGVKRAVFTGEVRTLPARLEIPLGWKRPRTVFVNSMSDLFHEAVPFDFIDRVFAVMALCPQHTFIVLTKRAERMAKYLSRPTSCQAAEARHERLRRAIDEAESWTADGDPSSILDLHRRPLPNVWLGVSAERQQELDERMPHLIRCPAAVRFLSCEPLLGELDVFGPIRDLVRRDVEPDPGGDGRYLHWVIAGGESGPGAAIRPCDIAHPLSILRQCREAGVPVFMKQMGSLPLVDFDDEPGVRCHKCGNAGSRQVFDVGGAREGYVWCNRCGAEIPCEYNLNDRKGGDPAEWPEDLRVREWPAVGGRA